MKRINVTIETEAKVRVDSFDEILERLEKSRAVLFDTVEETDTYFKDPDGRLIAEGSGLRLRKQEGSRGRQALLTFKGPVRQGPYKSRPEAETAVSDYEEMNRILTSLGCKPAIVVKKSRQLWKFKDCHVCLDIVPGLGYFVEVEGPNEKKIEQVLHLLNLDSLPHIQSGYARLLAEVLEKQAPQSADIKE